MKTYPKVGILAPISHNMPPVGYGPWELVVYNLQAALGELGVDVTVFATAQANITAKKQYLFTEPTGDKNGDEKIAVALLHTVHFLKHAKNFDILHLHHNIPPVLLTELVETPSVTTLHGCGVEKANDPYYPYIKHHNFISISNFERTFRPELNYIATVYNGVDTSLYIYEEKPDNYLLFSGRVVREKGAHNAITLAKKTGIPLKIAGPITDKQFFKEQIKPHIDNVHIEYLGNLPQKKLAQVIAKAKASLFLTEWDEPFGLSLIDSLVSGVPAIVTNKGALPELVNTPEVGIVVNSVEEATERIPEIEAIDRSACRANALNRFSRQIMAKKYLEAYMSII